MPFEKMGYGVGVTAEGDALHVVAVSSRLAMIGSQQSAQTLNANDLAVVPVMLWLNDLVGALVDSLVMAVVKILG